MSNFYLDGLEPNPPDRIDCRPEKEIITLLDKFTPVESESNLWMFWDRGFSSMPPWIQRSVVNCFRREGKRWNIRLLNNLPGSSNYILNYVQEEDFPAAATGKGIAGLDAGQHIADFARLAVIYRYGGIYMDAGILLLRDLDDICWSALKDPEASFTVSCMAQQMGRYPGQVLNGFIAARKHDPFIRRWQQIFLKIWQDRESAVGLNTHPLISHLPLLQINAPSIPPGADWVNFTDYLAQVQAFERVRLNRETGVDGLDGPAYFRRNFYLLDARTEMFIGQAFDGAEQVLRLLLLSKVDDGTSQNVKDQEEASRFVHDMLARSSCCKFSSGTGRLGLKRLVAKHWSLAEHAGDDSQPGTWGEYLRWGSVHLRQTRDIARFEVPEDVGIITHVGPFEPVLKR